MKIANILSELKGLYEATGVDWAYSISGDITEPPSVLNRQHLRIKLANARAALLSAKDEE